MSLQTPETVGTLQAALRAKAKESPDYRFYSLYDKLYRPDVLDFAYRRCRSNGGSSGVDGVSFKKIRRYGETRWLRELAFELKTKTYRPNAVRRVYIPKANGKLRPLGIPTIRDRVVQMAAVIVLEAIFEEDLQPEQHAYRPGHSAHDAIRQIRYWLRRGYTDVVDADLSGYFDTIPHHELLQSLARRISDGSLLSLLKSWLEMPVQEKDERGRNQRKTQNRDTGRGTPQGSPISPLFSNIYMRRFLLGWKTLGHRNRLESRVINYADDFVILSRGRGVECDAAMRDMMRRLRLTVNAEKTRLAHVPDDTFEFLGFRIGAFHARKDGRPYIGTRPSPKSRRNLLKSVSEHTARQNGWMSLDEVLKRLNRTLTGWANYFRGCARRDYRMIDQHVRKWLRRWMCKKHKVKSNGYAKWPPGWFEDQGLIRLREYGRIFP